MDMKWEVYQKLLFPTTRQWQIIANHHSCDNLIEQGDTLKLSRAIEHKVYFESAQKKDEFITLIQTQGFNKQNEMEVPFNGKTMYGVQFYRKDIPYYYDIDKLTMQIIDMSESLKGMYDGWECSLIK
jgi:hypothetical protein